MFLIILRHCGWSIIYYLLLGSGLWLNLSISAIALSPRTIIMNNPNLLSLESSNLTLDESSWELINWEHNGNTEKLSSAEKITIKFGSDRLVGQASCNNYAGSYTINDNNIKISQLATTRKACASDLMDQETKYLKALENMVSYQIDNTNHNEELLITYKHQQGEGKMIFTLTK